MRTGRRGLFIVIGGAAATMLGAVTAFAFWTTGGTGSGAGSTGAMQTVTVVAAANTPTSPLTPGHTGDVTLTVHNPNTFTVSVTSVIYNTGGSITFDGGHPSCTTSNSNPVAMLSVPGADLPLSVPALSTTSYDLAGAVTMDATATSACQGATIFIPVTLTAKSP